MKPTLLLLLSSLSALAHVSDKAPTHTHDESTHGTVLGHGDARYKLDLHWAKADPAVAPVINSHAIAEGRGGLIYVVTDHPKNAFVVFKKDGTYVRAFGENLGGGHGLEIFEKDGEEYIVHVDCGWHFKAEGWDATPSNGRVSILKTDGTFVRKLPTPFEMGIGQPGDNQFMPCDVAITPQGTILIVDGYASDYVYEMTLTGELIRRWGGKAEGRPENISNGHGISIDTANPEQPLVWVSSRAENKIKSFTLDGQYVDTLDLPGSFAGQLFFTPDRIYTAVCWSKKDGTGPKLENSGYLLVLDRASKKVISAPGGTEPKYVDGVLQPMNQETTTFLHGHDLYIDSEGAIYFGEWNAHRRYPSKLTPVK